MSTLDAILAANLDALTVDAPIDIRADITANLPVTSITKKV